MKKLKLSVETGQVHTSTRAASGLAPSDAAFGVSGNHAALYASLKFGGQSGMLI
jgi:hypothetical protein